MINQRDTISIDSLMLSFILDKTLGHEHFFLPDHNGSSEKTFIRFNNVQEGGGQFSISGEVEYDGDVHPICFMGKIVGNDKLTSMEYYIETELDGDDDEDEDVGEDWENDL